MGSRLQLQLQALLFLLPLLRLLPRPPRVP
jgi:hypothetical protein